MNKPPTTEDSRISVERMANNVGLKPSTLYQWIRTQQIPGLPDELPKDTYQGTRQYVLYEEHIAAAERFALYRWLYMRNRVEKEDTIKNMTRTLIEAIDNPTDTDPLATLEAFMGALKEALEFVETEHERLIARLEGDTSESEE